MKPRGRLYLQTRGYSENKEDVKRHGKIMTLSLGDPPEAMHQISDIGRSDPRVDRRTSGNPGEVAVNT